MSLSERMKTAIERNTKAIALRPSLARGHELMTVITKSDGICQVSDGDDSLKIDMGSTYGGAGTTPGAGFYVRAALAACTTQSYLIWAACFDVPIDQIKVEIHTDYDGTAGLGLESDATCGYTKVRMVVEIDSPAPRDQIEKVVETTESRSFMSAIFTEEHPVERELHISCSAAA